MSAIARHVRAWIDFQAIRAASSPSRGNRDVDALMYWTFFFAEHLMVAAAFVLGVTLLNALLGPMLVAAWRIVGELVPVVKPFADWLGGVQGNWRANIGHAATLSMFSLFLCATGAGMRLFAGTPKLNKNQ
jgi:hypothetical protein